MTETPRPGDQPLPTPGVGPGMHDLVIAELSKCSGTIYPSIIRLLQDRRDVGLERYGSKLQAHNGRDALRDLIEECLDGMVYARQVRVESDEEHVVDLVKLIEKALREATVLTQLLRMLDGTVAMPV